MSSIDIQFNFFVHAPLFALYFSLILALAHYSFFFLYELYFIVSPLIISKIVSNSS